MWVPTVHSLQVTFFLREEQCVVDINVPPWSVQVLMLRLPSQAWQASCFHCVYSQLLGHPLVAPAFYR